jgi:hypothetical protein
VVRADAREAELLTGCSIRSGDDAIAAGREILQHGPTLAALVAALADGLSPAESGQQAAVAAAQTVRHLGGRLRR